MNETVVGLAAFVVGVPACCALIAFVGALVFPSTRGAMAAWVHRKAIPDRLDESVSAQIMALRNEVYALRCEVAAGVRVLPAGDAPPR